MATTHGTGTSTGTGIRRDDGEDADALLRRLPGVQRFDLELVDATSLTPRMRRLRWSGAGLEHLRAEPGQDLMVEVPENGRSHFRRRYTIRHHHAPSATVDLDVLVHGDGPGARWASSVRPGARVEAIGPRGKVFLARDADWHLFCSDESGVPAALRMIEGLPPEAVALALLEVPDATEEQPVDARCDARIEWLHGLEPATRARLPEEIARLELPPGRGHAYVAGELHQVAAVREALVQRGLPAADIDHKPYWRAGVSNASHGEPLRTA